MSDDRLQEEHRRRMGREMLMREALQKIIAGMTDKDNRCWPTERPWTIAERDRVIVHLAREALRTDVP